MAMKKETDKDDIKSVRREEVSRGRRPIDTEQEELTRKFKRDFEELLLNGNRQQFRSFLIAHGLQAESERFDASMKLWEDYQKRH